MTISSESHGGRQRGQVVPVSLLVLTIGAIAASGGLLSYLIDPPKAIFLIFLTMVVWSVGGWLIGGWRLILAGLAALSAALAASNSDYFLSVAISALLFVFLSLHLHLVSEQS
jgi:hypothetical protein